MVFKEIGRNVDAGNRPDKSAQELGDIKNQVIRTGKRIPRLGKQGQEGDENSHFPVAEPSFHVGGNDVDRRNQVAGNVGRKDSHNNEQGKNEADYRAGEAADEDSRFPDFFAKSQPGTCRTADTDKGDVPGHDRSADNLSYDLGSLIDAASRKIGHRQSNATIECDHSGKGRPEQGPEVRIAAGLYDLGTEQRIEAPARCR